jgi:uncharacterized protein YndB with AHSA1/START domain
MAKAMITPDGDAVVSEIEIAAPPDRIFQALTTREQALQWGANEAFQMTRWEMDPRVGGVWRFTSLETETSREYEHHGKITEFDPPRLLAYTWFAKFHKDPSHPTMVRWELTPTSTGTCVKVTHRGLAALPEDRTGYSHGWPGLLEALKTFFEKKQGA